MISISGKIVDLLMRNAIIPADDKELYLYGFQQGLLFLANIITTIVIGLLFSMLIESVVFIIAYLPLRSYAGGYHAKKPISCYLISIVMVSVTLSVIRLPIWNVLVVIATMLMSASIIIILAPVEDSNKPLDEQEKVVYKKRACIILRVLIVLTFLCWPFEQAQISICITTALFILSIMLILGKVKNRF